MFADVKCTDRTPPHAPEAITATVPVGWAWDNVICTGEYTLANQMARVFFFEQFIKIVLTTNQPRTVSVEIIFRNESRAIAVERTINPKLVSRQ
ncbi:hypothetical protein AVEN_46174-1 [Araneus ventricosus]|uniref:Uncharacterized protein n=1 Tax=Araneus ventricosus TaxID=182803 RepID=A0A4Y2RH38_ARAVE|nr:hypothetical protein AVEN_46174-1 [Araneus ventricosus]